MRASIELFNNNVYDSKSAPDKLVLDNFHINDIDEEFVVCRDKSGNILSRFQDNIWDFRAYISNPSQYAIFNFTKHIHKQHIKETKYLMLLLMIFGNGRNGAHYSTKTLNNYFFALLKPLSNIAAEMNLGFNQGLETKIFLIKYIEKECLNQSKIIVFMSLLLFLDNKGNVYTKINYQHHKDIITQLKKLLNSFLNPKQTKVIPMRIFLESLSQRWKQIEEIEQNLQNFLKFLDEYMSSKYFATTKNLLKRDINSSTMNEAVKKYQLEELFIKYNIKSRSDFLGFIGNIQGTCAHLIHCYTGMRRGEVLNLKNDCINKVANNFGSSYIISSTSKLIGNNENAKWVTSKELQRVILILNAFNYIAVKQFDKAFNDLPLFISYVLLLAENSSKKIEAKMKLNQKNELPLDNSKLIVSQEDKMELEKINFNLTMQDVDIGKPWLFNSHQYRRTLAIYSIKSGLVSLGALQKQLKHLFKEMSLYYANGSTFAKEIFNPPQEHIANDINKYRNEIDALSYIKEVLFSDEQLYGGHGKFIEDNVKKGRTEKFDIFFLQNRDTTLKQFKNGDIAYKETALGGCISTEVCDYSLTRSIVACGRCESGIVKESKLDNVINKQKEFIDFLDKGSIEYRTEVRDLEELEKQKKLFLEGKV